MKRVAWFCTTIVCLVGISRGEGDHPKAADAPKSVMATAALTKSDLAVKKAEEAYVQAVLTAKRQCLKELDAAVKQAMQSSNLEEANRISAARKQVAAEIDQLTAGGKPPLAGNASGKGQTVYLEELEEESVKGAQWKLTKKGEIHGMPITVGGVNSPHGMGLNPSDGTAARITYKLAGQYRRLTGAAGINDSGKGFGSTIIFRIVGDGRELWRSRPIGKAGVGVAQAFDVDLSKVTTLELVSECAGGAASAHVVWLEPQLTESAK